MQHNGSDTVRVIKEMNKADIFEKVPSAILPPPSVLLAPPPIRQPRFS